MGSSFRITQPFSLKDTPRYIPSIYKKTERAAPSKMRFSTIPYRYSIAIFQCSLCRAISTS